jgi:hypothetical protein
MLLGWHSLKDAKVAHDMVITWLLYREMAQSKP